MGYPNKREVQDRAAAGEPMSHDEVSNLSREERDMTGVGAIPGGTAGTPKKKTPSPIPPPPYPLPASPRIPPTKVKKYSQSLSTTATAQSVHDKQMNFIAKAGEIARKPSGEITSEDAAEVRKREVRPLDILW